MSSRNQKNDSNHIVQHSIFLSIILHLFPGAIASVLYCILAPVLNPLGFPSVLTFLFVAVLIVIPSELGILIVHGYRLHDKKVSLEKVIFYREPIPLSQYCLFVPSLLVWAIVGYTVIAAPIDTFLLSHVFHWFPDQLQLNEIITNLSLYSKSTLLLTLVLGFLVNGIIGPSVEELYFRGFLLPRISRFKKWAPFINTVLFSVYHFFTPWQIFSRIIGLIPLFYVVWWKRNMYIGIWVHCLMNTIATILMAVTVINALS